MIQSAAERLDVVVWYHVATSIRCHQSFDLGLVYLALILGVHRRKQFCDLQVTLSLVSADYPCVESLNLPLYLSLDRDLDLDKLGEDAHYLIGTLLDFVQVLSLDFSEEAGRHFLVCLWDYEIDQTANSNYRNVRTVIE